MFFTIAPPSEGWLEDALNRDYWKHYVANSDGQIGYDKDAVFQAARYFDIPKEHLPAMVIFQDINRDDAVTVRLGNMNQDQWGGFFDNLFDVFKLVHKKNLQDLMSRGLKNLIDHLPWQRMPQDWLLDFAKLFVSPRLPQFERKDNHLLFKGRGFNRRRAAYRIEYPDKIEHVLRSMQEDISRVSNELNALRDEQREGFRQVNVRLEEIQVVLRETIQRVEEFREPFVEKWIALESADISPEELMEARQNLNEQFDNFLIEQNSHLAKRLDFDRASLPQPIEGLEGLLEPSSRSSLLSAELLWSELEHAEVPWIDYSVCGIGLWKALEIELNRTFVDALRVYHHLCGAGVFSVDQFVVVSGELKENAQVRSGKVQINKSRRDDASGKNKLLSIELGGVAGLLEKSSENTLAYVTPKTSLLIPGIDNNAHEYLGNIGKKVSVVANNYRNSHAHIRPMSLAKYQEFRTFMLDASDAHNPLLATLSCKQAFLRSGLI